MDRWPSIRDQRLADRLSLGDDDFNRLALKLADRVPAGSFGAAAHQRALTYPWQRPRHSFRLAAGRARELTVRDLAAATSAGSRDRVALVTFGSLGSPEVLAQRLGGSNDELHLITGQLVDHYVAPSAHLAAYGALPATIVPSPGASVRAGLLLIAPQQFELLTRLELNYRLAALPGESFLADLDWRPPERIFLYVSRHGAFAPDGAPPALRAVEAQGTAVPALTQEQVLEAAARVTLGPRSDAEALIRQTIEDYSWSVRSARPLLIERADPLRESDWELFSTRRGEHTE